ncbi:MAG: hypothetical protein ABI359_08900 [Ginsengibacter sp.]
MKYKLSEDKKICMEVGIGIDLFLLIDIGEHMSILYIFCVLPAGDC